jgi:N,N'-diacetyllegionaminate synthase
MKARINSVEISKETNGVYIVLEAGPTHHGLDSAKKLVKAAKDACANAVKFQFLSADRLMADRSVMFEYTYLERDTEGNERFVSTRERLYDILKRRELSRDEWKDLKRYCDKTGIPLFLTATYNDEVDILVDELGLDSVKINSSDITEIGFIKYCASKGINIQLDTGNADIWEIERAVIAAEQEGCKNIIIHHCPSGYPARLQSIHLNMIKTLKTMFPNYSIAFSDHSPGWEMDVAAVALGADMLEKTITLDRTIKSCEHSFSLEPEEAKRFVESIRELEVALGSARRIIPHEIMEKRKSTRRSPYALKDMDAGYIITGTDFECKRPGYGITSEEFGFFVGKKLIKGIKKGEALTYDYV